MSKVQFLRNEFRDVCGVPDGVDDVLLGYACDVKEVIDEEFDYGMNCEVVRIMHLWIWEVTRDLTQFMMNADKEKKRSVSRQCFFDFHDTHRLMMTSHVKAVTPRDYQLCCLWCLFYGNNQRRDPEERIENVILSPSFLHVLISSENDIDFTIVDLCFKLTNGTHGVDEITELFFSLSTLMPHCIDEENDQVLSSHDLFLQLCKEFRCKPKNCFSVTSTSRVKLSVPVILSTTHSLDFVGMESHLVLSVFSKCAKKLKITMETFRKHHEELCSSEICVTRIKGIGPKTKEMLGIENLKHLKDFFSRQKGTKPPWMLLSLWRSLQFLVEEN